MESGRWVCYQVKVEGKIVKRRQLTVENFTRQVRNCIGMTQIEMTDFQTFPTCSPCSVSIKIK